MNGLSESEIKLTGRENGTQTKVVITLSPVSIGAIWPSTQQ
jgi:hypothetical protein